MDSNSLVPVNARLLLEVLLEILEGRLKLLWKTVTSIMRCGFANAGE